MDGDLQHDPNDIPLFLEKLEEGYDIVSGWRKQRIDNFVMRRIPSRIANWLMAKLSGVDIHDFGTTFKAYRRELIEQALVASLQAKSKMTFGADGLSCHIELPLGSPVNEDLPRQLALE